MSSTETAHAPDSDVHRYRAVLASLLPPVKAHIFLSLPVSPHKVHISPNAISDLQVHPILEAALHILNLDLPSAHFLLRHMQADPAFEAMYLHGILHRVEGDIDNARAWYSDIKDQEVFKYAWKEEEGSAFEFLDRVEKWKQSKPQGRTKHQPQQEEERELAELSLQEIKRVIQFCARKFGDGTVADASQVWVSMSEKHGKNAEKMITGGEGWREF